MRKLTIGKNYCVVTYSWTYIGRLKSNSPSEIVLEGEKPGGRVALIGRTPRFNEMMATGAFDGESEVELGSAECSIGEGPGIVVWLWPHPLPTKSI